MTLLLAILLCAAGAGLLLLERKRRAAVGRLAHCEHHDALTGLWNLSGFQDRLDVALARGRRHGFTTAVLVVNLDRFEVANELLGWGGADRVLTATADRLGVLARDEDTVARLGGDEFAVLLEQVADPVAAARVAERVLDSLARTFTLGSDAVTLTASVGVAVSVAGDESPVSLLRDAGLAVRRAKDGGRARYEVSEPAIGAEARARLSLEAELHRGLEESQFELHYQPEVLLDTGEVGGVEALLRWRHPELGLLSPAHFVPLAEQQGLIPPIGRWVLEEACRVTKPLFDGRAERRPRLSVNVSGRQLQARASLVPQVAEILERTGFDPANLILEITESVLIENSEAAIGTLCGLRDLGVAIAIDDFGTGYSSLAYLKHFPVSVLKLDKAFVDGLDDAVDTAIVQSVLQLASTLNVSVTAEGVETAHQAACLQAMGCTRAQGFHFSKAVHPDLLPDLLDTRFEVGARVLEAPRMS
jgi:diguanylate cyclase (GGDEF)-like protein